MGTRISKHDFTCYHWVWCHNLLEKIPHFVENHLGKLQTVQWRKWHDVTWGQNQNCGSNFIVDLCNKFLLFQLLLLVFSQALTSRRCQGKYLLLLRYFVVWIHIARFYVHSFLLIKRNRIIILKKYSINSCHPNEWYLTCILFSKKCLISRT